MAPTHDDFKGEARALATDELLAAPSSTDGGARELLRRLRDLDLGARIAVRRGLNVQVAGCASRDEPVERGVRYRLRTECGAEDTLSLVWAAGALEVELHGPARWRRLRTALRLDRVGRWLAPELGARFDPSVVMTQRTASRFLRRCVRAAYA